MIAKQLGAAGIPAHRLQLAPAALVGRAEDVRPMLHRAGQDPGPERVRAEALKPGRVEAVLHDQVDRLWRKPRPHAPALAELAKDSAFRNACRLEVGIQRRYGTEQPAFGDRDTLASALLIGFALGQPDHDALPRALDVLPSPPARSGGTRRRSRAGSARGLASPPWSPSGWSGSRGQQCRLWPRASASRLFRSPD